MRLKKSGTCSDRNIMFNLFVVFVVRSFRVFFFFFQGITLKHEHWIKSSKNEMNQKLNLNPKIKIWKPHKIDLKCGFNLNKLTKHAEVYDSIQIILLLKSITKHSNIPEEAIQIRN